MDDDTIEAVNNDDEVKIQKEVFDPTLVKEELLDDVSESITQTERNRIKEQSEIGNLNSWAFCEEKLIELVLAKYIETFFRR